MTTESALHILLVDDEEIVHETIGDYLRESGHEVEDVFDGRVALEHIKAREYDLALVDVLMAGMDGLKLLAKAQEYCPDLSVVIITGHGDMDMAIRALRLGAADFLPKPLKLFDLDAALAKALRLRDLRRDRRHLQETIRGMQTADELREGRSIFVGSSAATGEVREQIRQAVEARCDTVLIAGETGTGKEVVAREIHAQSGAGDKAFIAVSCPALPDSLVESELFGHVRGAFTGATVDRAGYFELADGGTLFLDEVGDLSTEAQAKLLRVLETRTLRRVGGSRETQVDVRIVGATNKPLEDMAAAKGFRADLYYRLNVFTIELTPLRHRREDILPLAEHFVSIYAVRRGLPVPIFSPLARDLMLAYDFPGNARELRNLVERAAILCRGDQISPEHLHLPSSNGDAESPAKSSGDRDERAAILHALEEAKWNRRQAAQALNMPYSTLRYKIDKFGLS